MAAESSAKRLRGRQISAEGQPIGAFFVSYDSFLRAAALGLWQTLRHNEDEIGLDRDLASVFGQKWIWQCIGSGFIRWHLLRLLTPVVTSIRPGIIDKTSRFQRRA